MLVCVEVKAIATYKEIMRLLQCLVGVYLLAVSNVLCRGLTNRQDYVVTVEEASRAKIPKEEWVSNHMVYKIIVIYII